MSVILRSFLFLSAAILLQSGAQSPCTTTVTHTSVGYRIVTHRVRFRCFIFFTCRRNVRFIESYTKTTTVERCCNGYGPMEMGCPPQCEGGCGVNQKCYSPNNCICLPGTLPPNCTIDNSPCKNATMIGCEASQYCNNGSYACRCPVTSVLATDGLRCLDGVQNISVKALQTGLTLCWYPPVNHTADGNISKYNVSCSSERPVIAAVSSPVNITGLTPYTNYSCCITPHWVTNGVGPATCMAATTLQDVPGGPPVNVTTLNSTDYSMQILWQPPRLPNGVITHYNIYIRNSQITRQTSTVSYLLTGLTPGNSIYVSVSASTIKGEGPRSPELIITTGVTNGSASQSQAAGAIVAVIVVIVLAIILCAVVSVIVVVVIVRKKYYNKQCHRSQSTAQNGPQDATNDDAYTLTDGKPTVPYDYETPVPLARVNTQQAATGSDVWEGQTLTNILYETSTQDAETQVNSEYETVQRTNLH